MYMGAYVLKGILMCIHGLTTAVHTSPYISNGAWVGAHAFNGVEANCLLIVLIYMFKCCRSVSMSTVLVTLKSK